jgi:hypothetical protein
MLIVFLYKQTKALGFHFTDGDGIDKKTIIKPKPARNKEGNWIR